MEENAKSKILQTLIDSFTAMPSWLRSALVITLVLGFFYFGYARKEIIYSQEKQTTEVIYGRINDMNQKILKIEDLRVANEDMIYSIEEVRGIVVILYELHRQDEEIISSYMKKFRLKSTLRSETNSTNTRMSTEKQSMNFSTEGRGDIYRIPNRIRKKMIQKNEPEENFRFICFYMVTPSSKKGWSFSVW